MADEETETVENEEEEEPQPEPERSETDDLEKIKAALKKANAEAAKFRKEAKANEAAAKRVAELENANKSEAEKLADKAAAAEERASTAELKALRLEIAHDKGLTPAQAKRLVGATREELEADADDLMETFGAKAAKATADGVDGDEPKPSSGRPKETLRPGAANEDDESEIDRDQADKLAASIESGGLL